MGEVYSYDLLPYPSRFFLQTHPDRLATAATLYGMRPARVENCSVLELGCGNGSNLLAQAYGLPLARFVGIDLAEKHIQKARESAAELGLENVEFRQMDLMDLDTATFGKFDYIIAHGLFSWVPEAVRSRILQIFREMLEPNGVGYISYNAYPGAHLRELGRSILQMHAGDAAGPAEKAEQALSFLRFVAENFVGPDVYRQVLRSEVKRHLEHDAEDIFNDDLADVYRPFYFREFAEQLQGSGLQFLSEAEIHAASRHGLPDQARQYLDSLADVIDVEQNLDLLRGRVFRQTLFCHQDVQLDRNIKPELLDQFYLSSPIRPASPDVNIAARRIVKFARPAGYSIDIDHPLTKAALLRLGEIWGDSIATAELLSHSVEVLEKLGVENKDWEQQKTITRSILLQLCTQTDLIELHTYRPHGHTPPSDRPRTNRLSRWQMRDSRDVLTLLQKDLQIADSISRRLLELLDGTRGRTELLNDLRLFIESENIEPGERDTLPADLSKWLDDSLTELGRLGMFEE